jgi:hypothetical protein
MSTEPIPPPPVAPLGSLKRFIRVEYLGFQNVGEHREFRLRVYGKDESSEFRFRIAIAAFGAGRMRLQDGPDVCYQKLLQSVAAGDTERPDVITIDEADLASYRETHTHLPKHRSWTPTPSPTPAATLDIPPRRPRPPSPALPMVPLVTDDTEPALEKGQRVSHKIFGVGVTTSSRGGHTVVQFDQDGPKTFVTSMLELEVLSAPRTWETGPRGKNRPCRA